MTGFPCRLSAVVAALGMALASTAARAELAPLQPFQMVRSLQLVQDRIADGDHAALPMQRKLIELIDKRLLQSDSAEFDDGRNFRALLIYAMSGGNPLTVASILRRLTLDENDARMGSGVLEYLRGQPGRAANALNAINPEDVPNDVAAFLALVKGSIIANEDAKKSLEYLDMARLLSPGTLVEEAALRRSIALSVSEKETGRFLRASEQYVRRFLRSPYASQFADGFVSGVVGLYKTIKLDQVAAIIEAMNDEQAKVIYLRLARAAAIDQHTALLAFARAGLEHMMGATASMQDPRAILYSTLAAVTIDDASVVKARLESIERGPLSAGDRLLLDAAYRIVAEVTSSPGDVTAPPMMPNDEAALVAAPELVAGESAPDPKHADAGRDVAPADPSTIAVNESIKFVEDARLQLESVDKLLQETTQ